MTGPDHATVFGVVLRDQTPRQLGIADSSGDEYRSGPATPEEAPEPRYVPCFDPGCTRIVDRHQWHVVISRQVERLTGPHDSEPRDAAVLAVMHEECAPLTLHGFRHPGWAAR